MLLGLWEIENSKATATRCKDRQHTSKVQLLVTSCLSMLVDDDVSVLTSSQDPSGTRAAGEPLQSRQCLCLVLRYPHMVVLVFVVPANATET